MSSNQAIQEELEALRKKQITKAHRQSLKDQVGVDISAAADLTAFYGQQKQQRARDAKSRDEARALLHGYKGCLILGASKEDEKKILEEAAKRGVSVDEVAKKYGFESVTKGEVDDSIEKSITNYEFDEQNKTESMINDASEESEVEEKKVEEEILNDSDNDVVKPMEELDISSRSDQHKNAINNSEELSSPKLKDKARNNEQPVKVASINSKISSPMRKRREVVAWRGSISRKPGSQFPPETG